MGLALDTPKQALPLQIAVVIQIVCNKVRMGDKA
ncbi:unnamed protein product [Brassica rapa subsp. narinosa]